MTKVPIAGTVKTRLQPLLSGEECAAFASALLRDTEVKAKKAGFDTVIAFTPVHEEKVLRDLLIGNYMFYCQKGDSLGERMFQAFSEVLKDEESAAVMIGTDCPLLTGGLIRQAFELLESGLDAVVGPSTDGGYYLIGLRENDPYIFQSVDWSTSKALDQTLSNMESLYFSVGFLDELYDIDEADQLLELKKAIEENPHLARNTSDWFESHPHLFSTSS